MSREQIISIVMATYNGEKYVYQQLESIYNQTLKPDEVIIYDDCSSDNTYRIIDDFIKEKNLSTWRLERNSENKGWINNFYSLFERTNGDFIFCADQDDIWMKDKLKSMVKVMNQNKDIWLLGGNVLFVNDVNKINKTLTNLFTSLNKGFKISKVNFDSKFYLTHRPGCAIGFRKELLNYVENIDKKNYPHDKLLWNIAVFLEKAYILNKPVLRQRRHKESAIISKNNNMKRSQNIATTYELLNNFSRLPNEIKSAKDVNKKTKNNI